MHEAYNVHLILKQCLNIVSIAAYGSHVILGTLSGRLLMYSVDEKVAVNKLIFNNNFSKKPITQLEVTTEENLLFVLADSIIHVCDISRVEIKFAIIHKSIATKGCNLFALNVSTTKSTTGETATLIRVCCAIKRRLQFFYWKTYELKSSELSIELKDTPVLLCWVNDIVCVGYKYKYVMFSVSFNKPEKHDLVFTSSSHNAYPSIYLLRNTMVAAAAAAASAFEKNSLKPLMWSSPLYNLVWDEPYAIGRVSNGIEVRSFVGNDKDTLVQFLPELNKTQFLVRSDKGIIFAAAASELWCIRLVNIPTQCQQLLEQKEYQLAIDIMQVSDEPNEIKAETIRQLNIYQSRHLCDFPEFTWGGLFCGLTLTSLIYFFFVRENYVDPSLL